MIEEMKVPYPAVERDEWLMSHTNGRISHGWEDGRHRVVMSCQEHGDEFQKEAMGTGKTYLEAMLVALRNWEVEWGSTHR